jgi:3-oxoacyl-[acyl-carrier-protein] synthase II
MGLVTPLGLGLEHNWKRLLAGDSGARAITEFQTDDLRCKIACFVPRGQGAGEFDADKWVSGPDQRKMDTFIVYGIAAAMQAVAHSGWQPQTDDQRNRTGVLIGSGIGGLGTIEEGAITVKERGARRLGPFFIPAALINLLSGHVAIKFGFKGPNHSVVTACATGAHAIGDAARIIQRDEADVMIAGGAEAAICRLGVAGFSSSRALSFNFNDNPTKASRPWDKDRDGFVMGEGAGGVVIEELEHARKRGAKIYAEVKGYGMSGDAYHITAPSEDGEGGYRAMQAALKRAGMQPSDVDYVNAHGTSTMADWIEAKAIERLMGDHAPNVALSSTKSMIGHLLGAAGAVECVFCVLAIRDQIAPPTINLENPEQDTALHMVKDKGEPMKIDVAMSNSFGFGGTNATVVFRKVD